MSWSARDIVESMSVAYKKFDRNLFFENYAKLDIDSELSKKPKTMTQQSECGNISIL